MNSNSARLSTMSEWEEKEVSPSVAIVSVEFIILVDVFAMNCSSIMIVHQMKVKDVLRLILMTHVFCHANAKAINSLFPLISSFQRADFVLIGA